MSGATKGSKEVVIRGKVYWKVRRFDPLWEWSLTDISSEETMI